MSPGLATALWLLGIALLALWLCHDPKPDTNRKP